MNPHEMTRHQVPRGAMADAETQGVMHLIKMASHVRLTYQVRLLVHRAVAEGLRLELHLQKGATVSSDLAAFVKENAKHATLKREA